MSNKMTLKEFKSVLKDANIDFDFFGYEGILNLMVVGLKSSAATAASYGCKIVEKNEREKANAIFDYLLEHGFYDV